MRAICFIQEVKDSDLTMRQQQLICHRALRKLQWPCVMELFAQAGSEAQPLSLRPGMVDLLRAAAAGEVDVLMVIDVEHLRCGQAELDGLLMSLLQYGIHTFGAKNGQWIEPAGRHWMVLPGYNKVLQPSSLRKIHTMKTVKELPDGRTEVETVINGCNVTVVFAKDDNPEVMKNVTDLIMSAYAERIARDAQE